MPEFLNKIHAIEDSDGVTREIVPLGLQNNGYTATLPTLSADVTIALTSDIPTELFWVTYGTTTYEQITDAVSAGKLPVIKYNGITYTYSKDWGSALGHVFGTMDANFDRWVYCKQNSTWGTGYMEVENSVNKTNALTSSSTVTQYPNAKVVYDTFQLYAKTTDIPTQYIKSASSSGNTLTLTKQNNTTTTFTPTFSDTNQKVKTGSTTFDANDVVNFEGGGIVSVTGDAVNDKITISASALIPITHANLKTLRDGGNLIPGQQYRITDYQCTTTQTDTSSANHAFDIIVVADSNNELNEKARAMLHEGDTYFANSKLEAWQLWYCLDNDTNRFAWADSTNGKGVIYHMIDEFNNDVPYDFKNILFTKYNKYTDIYTFSYTENDTIKDASLLGMRSKSCYGNMMKEYISSSKQQLNFNVFYSTSTSFGCHDNIFGEDCYDNTFSYNCRNNRFRSNCYSNTFGNSCSSNIFEDGCRANSFGNLCFSNTFEDSCKNNRFGDGCNSNTFGVGCTSIIFGDSSSTINYCQYIIVDNGCSYININSTDTSATLVNCLQNVHIHLDVHGTSSSRKTITIPDRNLSYETNVYMDASYNIEMVTNSGIISAINANY